MSEIIPVKVRAMIKDEAAIESEIQNEGLKAPRLTPQHIDDQIVSADCHVFNGTTGTACYLTLRNGFTVIGESACASSENFDADLGRKIAFDNVRNKIWAFEGTACVMHCQGAQRDLSNTIFTPPFLTVRRGCLFLSAQERG